MKTKKLLITLSALLASFLVGGIGLGNDSGIFDTVPSDGALAAPNLTVTIDGAKVTLSWNKVTGASDYVVHYAQKPYDNPNTIKTIDVGDKTSASYDLSPGDTYHIAVKACKDSGLDCSNYSTIHDVIIPLASTFKNSLGQEFKLIPAGTFMMGDVGDAPDYGDDEFLHQVTLTQSFYMQTTEVTQAQWEAVMGNNPSYNQGCPNCPVEGVSWYNVQEYIAEMNKRGEGEYRLPTEAQWEYACRAGSTTAIYNGNLTNVGCEYEPNLAAIAWYCYNSKVSYPVAQKIPNAWGLYDMLGNIEEWCQDWYGPKYYYEAPGTDPPGPSSGLERIVRGGDTGSIGAIVRSSFRWGRLPDQKGSGFRLLRQP